MVRATYSSGRVGWKAASTLFAVISMAASQATGRQRGDSSRPVGNNSSVKVNVRPKMA
jgi:hypothetical protein